MYKVIEVVVSLLLMYGGVELGKIFSDSLYEIHLSNGEIINIKVNKDNIYSCPTNCGAYHFHSTITNEKIDDNYSMNFEYNNKITLNEYVVSKIYNIKLSKDKKSKMKTSKEQVSLKNFILKY